jgi:hypothetical protein
LFSPLLEQVVGQSDEHWMHAVPSIEVKNPGLQTHNPVALIIIFASEQTVHVVAEEHCVHPAGHLLHTLLLKK